MISIYLQVPLVKLSDFTHCKLNKKHHYSLVHTFCVRISLYSLTKQVLRNSKLWKLPVNFGSANDLRNHNMYWRDPAFPPPLTPSSSRKHRDNCKFWQARIRSIVPKTENWNVACQVAVNLIHVSMFKMKKFFLDCTDNPPRKLK